MSISNYPHEIIIPSKPKQTPNQITKPIQSPSTNPINANTKQTEHKRDKEKGKNFDILDREAQIKILSSEREKLQLGLQDFIERRLENDKNNDDDDDMESFLKENNTEEIKGLFDLSTEKIEKLKLRRSNILTNKMQEMFRTKSYNEDEEVKEIFRRKNRRNSVCESEIPVILPSTIKQSPSFRTVKTKQNDIKSPRRDSKKKRVSLIELEEGEMKMKLFAHEKNVLKNSLINEGEDDDDDDEDSSKKTQQIIRELIKMKQVYDSCSDEEVQTEEDNKFLIYPHSYFKYTWDLIIFLMTMISIVYVPLTIAFDIKIMNGLFIDIVFFIDLILNFWMGYYDNEENLIVSPKKIFEHYLFSWFWIDLLSCIPFNTLNYHNYLSLNLYSLCLFRLFKYFKLNNSNNFFWAKLIKKAFCFNRTIKRLFKTYLQLSQGLRSLLHNIFRFVLIIHILSSIWIYLSRLCPGNNWTIKYNDNAPDYKGKLYLISVYFNMVSVLTLGYGDVLPVSFIERFYSLVLLIMSLGINTYAVSFLENLADLGNQMDSKLESKKDFLENISINYKVNYELYEKILGFIKYNYQGEKDEKDKFIHYLPTTLRNLLICNMYRDIIDHFTFFKHHRDDNIEFKAKILLSLRPVIAYKGEEVIRVDQVVDEIIFVKFGQLSMFITYKNIHIRLLYLRKYEHFGEQLVLQNIHSPVGLKVISLHKTELLLLRKADFLDIVRNFKENFENILVRATENMKRIQKVIRQKKSQIRKMLTQAKTFKQATIKNSMINSLSGNKIHATGTMNMNNNTMDYYNNMNQTNFIKGSVVNNNPLMFMKNNTIKSVNRSEHSSNSSISFKNHSNDDSKNSNKKEIKITLNVNNQLPQSQQNVFININSQSNKDFEGVKNIKVTINNNNSSNENNEAKRKNSLSPTNHNHNTNTNTNTNIPHSLIDPSPSTELTKPKTPQKPKALNHTSISPSKSNAISSANKNVKNTLFSNDGSDIIFKKKTEKKMKSTNDLISLDNTTDVSYLNNKNFLDETLAQNNTKKIYLKIYNSIRQSVANTSEEMKLGKRLHQMFKQYLDYDIEHADNSDSSVSPNNARK